jgi:hypothetical protein
MIEKKSPEQNRIIRKLDQFMEESIETSKDFNNRKIYTAPNDTEIKTILGA